MGQLVGKIVLTGGLCAGKTTALARIEQDLSEQFKRRKTMVLTKLLLIRK